MKIMTTILVLFISIKSNCQVKDTLTNEKIIQLTQLGLQPSVIVMKIQSSIGMFDVSMNDLISLNNSKVSPDVITEMMRVANKQQDVVSNLKNSSDPSVMHPSGIYYFNSSDTEMPLKRADGMVANYRTSGGSYGGFGGSSTSAVVSGKESKMKIVETLPTFYIYFNDNGHKSADWFASTSPNEFALVKFIEKRNERSFKIGGSSSNSFGGSSNSGIPEKIKIPFEYVQVAEGIYKITFKESLKEGEYCFAQEQNLRKVFDFSISTSSR